MGVYEWCMASNFSDFFLNLPSFFSPSENEELGQFQCLLCSGSILLILIIFATRWRWKSEKSLADDCVSALAVLVTGCDSGVGQHVAARLLSNYSNFRVIATLLSTDGFGFFLDIISRRDTPHSGTKNGKHSISGTIKADCQLEGDVVILFEDGVVNMGCSDNVANYSERFEGSSSTHDSDSTFRHRQADTPRKIYRTSRDRVDTSCDDHEKENGGGRIIVLTGERPSYSSRGVSSWAADVAAKMLRLSFDSFNRLAVAVANLKDAKNLVSPSRYSPFEGDESSRMWLASKKVIGLVSRKCLLVVLDVTSDMSISRTTKLTRCYLHSFESRALYSLINCAGYWDCSFLNAKSGKSNIRSECNVVVCQELNEKDPSEYGAVIGIGSQSSELYMLNDDRAGRVWDHILSVNLRGPIRMIEALLPMLSDFGGELHDLLHNSVSPSSGLEGQESNCGHGMWWRKLNGWTSPFCIQKVRRSRIVTVGSILGRIALPFQPAYVASKFGLSGALESLRPELKRMGITSTLVEPGTIRDTKLFDGRLTNSTVKGSIDHRGTEEISRKALGTRQPASPCNTEPVQCIAGPHRPIRGPTVTGQRNGTWKHFWDSAVGASTRQEKDLFLQNLEHWRRHGCSSAQVADVIIRKCILPFSPPPRVCVGFDTLIFRAILRLPSGVRDALLWFLLVSQARYPWIPWLEEFLLSPLQ